MKDLNNNTNQKEAETVFRPPSNSYRLPSKIMIIGCGGSGKSTLSKKLHQLTGLELIHLDQIFWTSGWKELPIQNWKDAHANILATKNQWILDGNYGSTMDSRLGKADAIIFLNMPTYLLLYRVLKRTFQYYGQSRPDMPANCPERISFKFLHYILFYNKTRTPSILKKLAVAKKEKKNVFILRNDKEVEQFLDTLTPQ